MTQELTKEQLKKLPRDTLLKFLANLKQQATGKDGDHKFISAEEPKRENYRNALRQKLEQMKLQRSGKKAIQKKMDEMKSTEVEKKDVLPTVLENSEPESESEDSDTEKVLDSEKPKKTLRNKKRRERRKRNAVKSLQP